MAGKGGGAWKVAYADFVTAMMAFFLVMWITAQSKQVKQAVAAYFVDPSGTENKSGGQKSGELKSGEAKAGEQRSGDSRAGEAKSGEQKSGEAKSGDAKFAESGGLVPTNRPSESLGLKIPGIPQPKGKTGGPNPVVNAPEGPGVKRKVTKSNILALHEGDREMRGTAISFAEESAELTDAAKRELQRLVSVIRGKRHKIELRGHTTRRPLPAGSPYKDAWELSFARCLATMKYLEQQGVEPERMRLAQAGGFEPHTIRADALPEKKALNSRVEVYVLNELVEDLVGTREERALRVSTP